MNSDFESDLPRDSQRDEKPSKTRLKQTMHELQTLGMRLTKLTEAQLAEIDLPDNLREAVHNARRITKHEARRRQMQFIGRLMRETDPVPIRAKLDYWSGQSTESVGELHRIERWRERLLEDDGALTEFAQHFPGADLQAIRASVREVRKDARASHEGHTPRASRQFRELYQLIKRAADSTSKEHSSE